MSDNNFNDGKFSRFSVDDESQSSPEVETPDVPDAGKKSLFKKSRSSQAAVVYDDDYGDAIPQSNVTERDFRPVRQRRDGKTGILGGFMYFVFIISISLILACLGWMAATDVLALNKEEISATVTLPEELFTEGTRKIENEDGTTQVVDAEIADIGEVATLLKNAGIIEYKSLFKFYSSISDAKYKLDPGTYELSTIYDYRALVKKMQFGSDSQVRTKVTFPEGFTVRQVFQRLEENRICKFDELMDAAANFEFSTERYPFLDGIPTGDASRLEGFLFPDTYEFYQGMTPEAAIDTFLQIFKARITAEMLDWIAASGRSYRDIINIAAMIEKETSGSEEDRRNIASVIYNRLRLNMFLGVDATSIYSHQDYEGNPAEMINTWVADESDPYNTRKIMGLPPTPIANPGILSITAALKPNTTNYTYYALDTATGEHKFFTNANDFNNFVATQNYG